MIATVVFSRFSSSRLPGKALLDIAGRPLLGRVLDRVCQAKKADRVIVATSVDTSDDVIEDFARKEGVAVFRGSLDDVSERALACMRAYDLDVLVRICADSPFIDPSLIDTVIDLRARTEADVASNVFCRSFPAGQSVEVVTREAFERAYPRMSSPAHFEHVTKFFYEHPADFRIENLRSAGGDLTALNLCVDTQDDARRATWIARRLESGMGSNSLQALIETAEAWYARHPQVPS